jgi:hypothetical protein
LYGEFLEPEAWQDSSHPAIDFQESSHVGRFLQTYAWLESAGRGTTHNAKKNHYIAGNILFRSIRIAAYPQADLLAGSSEEGISEIAALLRA